MPPKDKVCDFFWHALGGRSLSSKVQNQDEQLQVAKKPMHEEKSHVCDFF